MTADTVSIADLRSSYVMGVASVNVTSERDHLWGHTILRYVWKINGTPIRALEFNATREGRLGRLVSEWNAPIGAMVKTEVKK